MHLDDALAAGGAMQAVDVLRDEQEAIAEALLERDQRVVAGVRRDAGHAGAALRVELPHERRVVARSRPATRRA